jgi:hypothetical protein
MNFFLIANQLNIEKGGLMIYFIITKATYKEWISKDSTIL